MNRRIVSGVVLVVGVFLIGRHTSADTGVGQPPKSPFCAIPVQSYAAVDVSGTEATTTVHQVALNDQNQVAFSYHDGMCPNAENWPYVYAKQWNNGTVTLMHKLPMVKDVTFDEHGQIDGYTFTTGGDSDGYQLLPTGDIFSETVTESWQNGANNEPVDSNETAYAAMNGGAQPAPVPPYSDPPSYLYDRNMTDDVFASAANTFCMDGNACYYGPDAEDFSWIYRPSFFVKGTHTTVFDPYLPQTAPTSTLTVVQTDFSVSFGNARGSLVGTSGTADKLWKDGAFVDLSPYPSAINESDDVLGFGNANYGADYTINHYPDAYLFADGQSRLLFSADPQANCLIPARYRSQLRDLYPMHLSNRMVVDASTGKTVTHILFFADTQRRDDAGNLTWWSNVLFVLDRFSDGTTDLHEVDQSAFYSGYVAAINSSGVLAVRGVTPQMAAQGSGAAVPDHALLLVPIDLVVDANHDGQMSFTDPTVHDADITTIDKPYAFWTNDDDDSSGNENATSGKHDYDSTTIKSKRDLEDFTRLWISFKGITDFVKNPDISVQLTWSPKDTSGWQATDGSPQARIFKAVDEQNGGVGYITNDGVAESQIAGDYGQQLGTGLFGGGNTVTLPLTGFLDTLSESNPYKYLLFEGVAAGVGRISIQFIRAGQVIGRFAGPFVRIKDIKNMYEAAYPSPVGDFSYPYVTGYHDPSLFGFTNQPVQLQPEPDESHHCIVFVSGWTTPDEQPTNIRKAEAFYKRLWWQGYKGRFAAFLWYGLARSDAPLHPLFNQGEFRGWKYGASLADFVENLQAQLPNYDFSIIGHSLGAVPVASALKQMNKISNCVFVLGSLAAGCCDVRDSINSYNLFDLPNSPTPDYYQELGYRGYLLKNNVSTPIRGGVVTDNVTSFYNPYDLYLVEGMTSWENNQVYFRPENNLAINPPYEFLANGTFPNQIVCHPSNGGSRYVTDPLESMPFVARARSQALGALANVGGSITANVNIGAGTSFNVGTSDPEHNPMINRSIQGSESLFKELLLDINLIPVLQDN